MEIRRISDLEAKSVSEQLDQAALVLGQAFNGAMGAVFPNGVTPELLAWRRATLARTVKLDALGKPSRLYLAIVDGTVVGLASSYSEDKQDPSEDWEKLVAKAIPPQGDVDLELWRVNKHLFSEAIELAVGDEKVCQELVYLCVDPASQRGLRGSSVGSALLSQVLADGGPHKTVLIAAPTPSARPFYLKHGGIHIVHEGLEALRLPDQEYDEHLSCILFEP